MSPGMGVDKYVLSSDDLKHHRDVVHHWGPCQLVRKLMSDEGFDAHLTNPITGKDESLQDLVCFGSPEVSLCLCLKIYKLYYDLNNFLFNFFDILPIFCNRYVLC